MRYLFVIIIFFMISCTKENSCSTCIGSNVESDATIVDGGSPAVDGCDWLIHIDTLNYHPLSLGNTFKQNGLAVKINYQLTTDSFSCGDFALSRLHVIKINSIIRR